MIRTNKNNMCITTIVFVAVYACLQFTSLQIGYGSVSVTSGDGEFSLWQLNHKFGFTYDIVFSTPKITNLIGNFDIKSNPVMTICTFPQYVVFLPLMFLALYYFAKIHNRNVISAVFPCAKCGYDISSDIIKRCPECGQAISSCANEAVS
jgi:hypothetical protein